MEVLVTYDVSTETTAGRRRLRRVAKACQAYGQRVQKSVFECIVNEAQFEELKHTLSKEIKDTEDSLRFYRLREPRGKFLVIMGKLVSHDLHDPLII